MPLGWADESHFGRRLPRGDICSGMSSRPRLIPLWRCKGRLSIERDEGGMSFRGGTSELAMHGP